MKDERQKAKVEEEQKLKGKQRSHEDLRLFYFLPFALCFLPFVFIGICFLSSFSSAQEKYLSAPLQKPKFVPGEVIIKLKESAPVSKGKLIEQPSETGVRTLDFLNTKYNVRAITPVFAQRPEVRALREDPLANVLKLEIDKDRDPESAALEYASLDEIEYAEPNYFYFVSGTPDDSFFPLQYGLQTGDKQGIDAVNAWDIQKGSSSIIIGVVDSGVDYNHEDLAGKVIKGYDFANNDQDPMDDNGHGTHVSGIAAAVANNKKGVAGVCWNCRILAIKSVDANGSGANTWIANGISYAADHGARVVNLSLGGSSESFTMKLAIDDAYRRNVVIVAASGNDNAGRVEYPAALPSVISVGATNAQGAKATFSNYGSVLTVVAPGQAIYSALPDNQYQAWSGTSMATPHVAGLVGLILSKNPSLFNTQVLSILTTSTDDLGDPGRDIFFGFGRINAFKAITQKEEPGAGGTPTAPPLPPQPGTGSRGVCGSFFQSVVAASFLIIGRRLFRNIR
jgi:thermitase